MTGIRDARFGRLRLPSIFDDVAESVGDQLTTVGGGVIAGERQPRPFKVTLPLHGTEDLNPYSDGDKMRRQLRSLMENARAKWYGTYFQFSKDPELDSWLVAGAADLAYDEGGVSLSQYKLTFTDVYKVGSLRTHRAARRVELFDRRLVTTPRDLLGTLYSTGSDAWYTGYHAQTATAVVYLPVGISDVTGSAKRMVTFLTRASLGGNVAVVSGASHGEVLSFEWDPTKIHGLDDVVIYDRRGDTTTGTSDDPEVTNGWEEIYGPDYPIHSGDVPIIQNGLVRVRYDAANRRFPVDLYTGGSWVEQLKIVPGLSVGTLTALASAQIVEWTSERGVIGCVFTGSGRRAEVYITLQRGWLGPRVEIYPKASSGTPTGVVTLTAAGALTAGSVGSVPAFDVGGLAGTLAVALVQATVGVAVSSGSVVVTPPGTETYVSAQLGFGYTAAELGAEILYEARAVPELVARYA